MIRLRQLRLARGKSQSALGRTSGVNQVVISAIETGHLQPYGSQLRRLAKALAWNGEPERLLDEVTDHDEDEG